MEKKTVEDCDLYLLSFEDLTYLKKTKKYFIRHIDEPKNVVNLAIIERKQKKTTQTNGGDEYLLSFVITHEEKDGEPSWEEEIKIKMFENPNEDYINEYEIYGCEHEREYKGYVLKGGKKSSFRKKHKSIKRKKSSFRRKHKKTHKTQHKR